MKRSEFLQRMNEGAKRRAGIHLAKSSDYASEDDCLLNFKQVHQVCKILDIDTRRSAQDIALFFVVCKLQRICNLRGKVEKNESRRDTVDDCHIYLDLADALGEE